MNTEYSIIPSFHTILILTIYTNHTYSHTTHYLLHITTLIIIHLQFNLFYTVLIYKPIRNNTIWNIKHLILTYLLYPSTLTTNHSYLVPPHHPPTPRYIYILYQELDQVDQTRTIQNLLGFTAYPLENTYTIPVTSLFIYNRTTPNRTYHQTQITIMK